MKRIIGRLVIIGLDAALIVGFLALSGAQTANVMAMSGSVLDGYSFETVVIGICGLIYLKIIWKLIHRY